MNAKSILIVEDEQPIREMVVFSLAGAGFEVREAADARQAQSCIAERLPDLVLLDFTDFEASPGFNLLQFQTKWPRVERGFIVGATRLTKRVWQLYVCLLYTSPSPRD